jgi:predicted ATPase
MVTELTECAGEARHGPKAFIVAGDEGVGKSRLLSVVAEHLRSAGDVVLTGRCLDVGDLWPYYPLRDALERAARDSNANVDPAAISRLLNILDIDGQGSERLLVRLYRELGELAGGRLLVLVLDDLQWADSSTIRLMLTLLSGLTITRMLVLAAVRIDDQHSGPAIRGLLRELQRSQSATVAELAPLDRAATLELVEQLAEPPLAPVAARAIWRCLTNVPPLSTAPGLLRRARSSEPAPSALLPDIHL